MPQIHSAAVVVRFAAAGGAVAVAVATAPSHGVMRVWSMKIMKSYIFHDVS